MGRKDTTILRS